MADPNGNGGSVKITGQMLLSVLGVIALTWVAWVTAGVMVANTLDDRINGIVSTLSCTQKDGNKTPAEGK